MSNLFFIILHNNLSAHIFIISHENSLPLPSRRKGKSPRKYSASKGKTHTPPRIRTQPVFSPRETEKHILPSEKNGRECPFPPDSKNFPANGDRKRPPPENAAIFLSALFEIPFSPAPCGGGQREQS